jgi:predicted DNA repair protein MutK
MAGGLFALLDDVALIAKKAAASAGDVAVGSQIGSQVGGSTGRWGTA